MSDPPAAAENWEELQADLAKRGVIINVLAPFVLLGIAYMLRGMGFLPEIPQLDDSMHQTLVYVFGVVALGELAVAFYLKRMWLRASWFVDVSGSFGGFSTRCIERMTIVFAVGASPAVYGFVLYALGGTIEQFIFFILISLVAYRLVRPGKAELEKLWEQVRGQVTS